MEFFRPEFGIAGVCVLLTILVVVRVGEFMWKLRERKDSLSEASIKELTKAVQENTAAARELDSRLKVIEKTVSGLPKFKTDIRRFYSAIKRIAGDQWPKIRDEILKDEYEDL